MLYNYSMEKDYIIEEISNYKDQRRNLWAVVILLSGGSVGLIYKIIHLNFSINSFVDILMFMSGILLNYFFFNTITSYNQEITKLLNKLKEVKE